MAQVFTSQSEIDVSPERIVEALTKFEDWRFWMPGYISVESLTDQPFGVGTRWRETRKMFGRKASEVFQVTEFSPPEVLSLSVDGSEGTTGKGEYFFEYRFVGDSEKTTVYLDAKIDIPGFVFRIIGKKMIGMFKKACDGDMEALKQYLEKQVDTTDPEG